MNYQQKKERMERDPEFKRRVLAQQAKSRRERRERELNEAMDAGVCGYLYANDRHCWKVGPHMHQGEVHDGGTREIVVGEWNT